MHTYWPLIVLLAPLVVTLFSGRTAWVWLSLCLGTAIVSAMVQYVLFNFANGNTDPLFSGLLLSNGPDRAYHDTYYVVASFSVLTSTLLPSALIGLLLLLPAHPRRAKLDLALFWTVIALVIALNYGMALILGQGGMPRRYVDYADAFLLYNTISRILTLATVALLLIAAARPIRSWWRARKAAHAL